jgi:amino acid adenylation domain-containing protein
MKINLTEYFEETIKINSDKTAVIDGDRAITFSDLYVRSKVVATRLINQLEKTNRPIAVYLPKTTESLIADIAILYSGNFYMNLDVKSPVIRIKNIIDIIRPVALITNSNYINTLDKIDKIENIINIDEIDNSDNSDKALIDNSIAKLIDTDPLCIINTSGSTGTPKGVVLNHRSFIDFIEWATDTLNICDNEVIGSLSPIVFDIYSFELCMLMAKGSTMVLIPDQLSAFSAAILQLMKEKQVTYIFWVPTIMVNIANNDLLGKIFLPDLKTVWFAGEVFPSKQFNYWRTMLPLAKLVNLYGPIEITLDCTYFIADTVIPDDQPLPIGFACRNTHIIILNERNEPAGINEEGELCVRGTSLAMGYYNNPEKTALAFVQNPLNKSYPELIYRTGDIALVNERGEIIFKGRKDSMIKHMGYRIELAEIEHVIINTLRIVENGCVLYNRGNKEITLFYESKTEIPVADFKKRIGEVFPKYMIPTKFLKMEELPRNTNGKIDRLLLSNMLNNDKN